VGTNGIHTAVNDDDGARESLAADAAVVLAAGALEVFTVPSETYKQPTATPLDHV
jgi:hypothetical protein